MRHFMMVVTVALLVVAWSLPSVALEPEWTTEFDFGGNSFMNDLLINDGQLVLAGAKISGGEYQAALTAFSVDGSGVWTIVDEDQTHNSTGVDNGLARVGGDLFWLYSTSTFEDGDMFFISRRDNSGGDLWANSLSPLNTTITSTSNSILCLETTSETFDSVSVEVFSLEGAHVDSFLLAGNLRSYPLTAETKGSYLWVSSFCSEQTTTSQNVAMIKFNLANQETAWRWELENGESVSSAVDASGNSFVVCSQKIGGGDTEQLVATKLDPDGNEVWQTSWIADNTHERNFIQSVAVSDVLDVVVVGGSVQALDWSSDSFCYLSLLDKTSGVLLWEEIWQENPDAQPNQVKSCRFDASGNLYVGGNAQNITPPNICFLRKYSHHLMDVPGGEASVPQNFALSQNYPNPFNATTRIVFTIPVASEVELSVYSVLGREVARVASGQHSPGRHVVTWNADGLPSGTYLYRLRAGGMTETRRLVLVK